MKKLMIAAAIVCAAAMSQAAVIKWGNTSSSTVVLLDGSSAATSSSGVTLYLMQVGAGTDGADKAVASTTKFSSMTAGALDTAYTSFNYTYGTGEGKSGIVQNDEFYILATMTSAGKDYEMIIDNGGENWVLAAGDNGGTDTFVWKSGTYGGLGTEGQTGKWVEQSVPEPTSGLLLVLGMAGLALRRRRA